MDGGKSSFLNSMKMVSPPICKHSIANRDINSTNIKDF